MKKFFCMLVVLALVSCTDQYMAEGVTGDPAAQAPVSEIDVLKEKVRWGDGEACLKLADCYRDGLGVKTDFLNMMYTLTLAEDYGAINKAQDYFKEYPANNEVEYLSNWVKDADDREAFQGIMAIERGDTFCCTTGKPICDAVSLHAFLFWDPSWCSRKNVRNRRQSAFGL